SSITDPGAGYGGSTPHEYPASSTPSSYGQGAPGGDPLSGGYPSMAHSDQGFDSRYFQGSPYDSGTHNRPTYDTDPYGLSSPTPTNRRPPPPPPPSPHGTASRDRPTYSSPPFRHSDQGFDSGYFQGSPYDSGTHNRPTYDTDPYGLSSPTPSNPGP